MATLFRLFSPVGELDFLSEGVYNQHSKSISPSLQRTREMPVKTTTKVKEDDHHGRGDNVRERRHPILNFFAGLGTLTAVGAGIWLVAWLCS